MTFRLHSITFDCETWEPMVEFWLRASDFVEDPANPNQPGDPVGALIHPESHLQLLFIPGPDTKTVKNRLHLDLRADGVTTSDELERLLALGARPTDVGQGDDVTWVVLSDPEGNEFCLLSRTVQEAQS